MRILTSSALVALLALAAPAHAVTPPVPVGMGSMLVVAAQPDNSAERRDARSRLFHEVLPRIESSGLPASQDDARGMAAALGDMPCAGGKLRVDEALVLGDAARVRIAGTGGGGCSALLMRDGDGWRFVMILSWTLR
jgi:hypothetical protein